MRNLTIKRIKKFTASLVSAKIYIEDHLAGDTNINDVPCRKLGSLKNGEEKTFQIDDNAAKVFVIADKLSKGFCNEYYSIPAGTEDVYLTGRNKFNLANGNAFIFDNNESEDVIENRKRSNKKGSLVMIAAVIVGACIGFVMTSGILDFDKPRSFTVDEMTVTLTDDFTAEEIDRFNKAYVSDDVAVYVLKEEFSLLEGFGDLTIEQYGELVSYNNSELNYDEFVFEGGRVFFEYTVPIDGNTFHYFSYLYKTDDALWMISFATLDKFALN